MEIAISLTVMTAYVMYLLIKRQRRQRELEKQLDEHWLPDRAARRNTFEYEGKP